MVDGAGGAKRGIGTRTVALRGVVAAVVATVVNGVIVVVVPDALGLPAYNPLSLPPVVIFTVLGVVGAAVVYWLALRYADRPVRTFTVVAALALLVSFVPDLTFARGLPGATTTGVVLLMVMHLVAAVVAVAVLTRGVSGVE